MLFHAPKAHAQLIINLAQDVLTGSRGDTLTFSGSLLNTGNETVHLNAVQSNLNAPGLTVSLDPFTFNAPSTLLAGETWSGDLFTVAIGSQTKAPHEYIGAFIIEGGSSTSAGDELARAGFKVNAEKQLLFLKDSY